MPEIRGLAGIYRSLYTWRLFEQPAAGVSMAPHSGAQVAGPHGYSMALFFEFLAQQWILVAALLTMVALLIFHESRKSGPSVSPQQAIHLINREEGLFVDLRDGGDFSAGHISDAVNIPTTKVESRMAELEKFRDRPIVLVCKMGQQAGAVGKQLRAAGFNQVYRMTGGMMEWNSQQLPLVK